MSDECELKACRICTACYHGNHAACWKRLTCPADHVRRDCECCGKGAS